MRELGLDRLSEDGRFLVARDTATGETFHIPVDHRLTSLVAKSSSSGIPAGQLEIKMESSLSPRDIQTRIRRGETVESVAESAGVPVDQIDRFAGPVLAEREYMCEQARKTTIRRKHVGGTGVLLGVLVNDNIAADGGVPESAIWDSWRREDGRWNVTVTPAGEQPANFLFDVKSRYVVPADEFAHGLVGDVALPDSADMAIADAVRVPSRKAPVESEDLVDEIIDEVGQVTESTEDLADVPSAVSSIKEARDRRVLEQQALDAKKAQEPEPVQAEHDDDFEESIEHDVAVPDTMGPRKKRHERRRVPSWDEIMFGDKND
ncbi:septation protein SepH [Aeromicrobium panaciterrae]|uniref:septation protein SepH n=1 Tax=Aeromicrobium panaciterrae TaxID=363861 RepID=UPI0031D464A9